MRFPETMLSLLLVAMLPVCGGEGADAADELASATAEPRSEARSPAGEPERGSDEAVVLGTIEATFDGEQRTWYVVRGEARSGDYSSALWMEGPEGRRIVSLSGLDSDAPPIESFSVDPSGVEQPSLGDYEGGSFSIVAPLPEDGGTIGFSFPEDDGAGADLVFTPDAASIATGIDMTRLYALVEGSLEVASGAVVGGTAAIRGTFAGVLESVEGGQRITVEDGRFEAQDVPSLEAMGGAASTAGAETGAPPVTDAEVERLYGLYGEPDGRRNFFVAEATTPPDAEPLPAGYVAVGAMWGDVAPWYLRPTSETRFEQVWVSEYQEAPLVVEFELSSDGWAVALRFETMFDDRGRLERIGDLPDGW